MSRRKEEEKKKKWGIKQVVIVIAVTRQSNGLRSIYIIYHTASLLLTSSQIVEHALNKSCDRVVCASFVPNMMRGEEGKGKRCREEGPASKNGKLQ